VSRTSLGFTTALLLTGCHSGAGQAAPETCERVADIPSASISAESLAGEYQLRLVAGDASASGTLTLVPQDTSAQRRPGPSGIPDPSHRYPLIGGTELDLAAVGAVASGTTASLDPAAPGVLLIERIGGEPGAPGRLMLRLGSEANRPDRLRFDGGYTVLRVRQADEHGFAGDWESGAPLPRASGYFCALRRSRQ